MTDYIRVKDKTTGHEYTVAARLFDDKAHTKLDKAPLTRGGEVAPPKFKTSVTKAAQSKSSGQQAETPKENS